MSLTLPKLGLPWWVELWFSPRAALKRASRSRVFEWAFFFWSLYFISAQPVTFARSLQQISLAPLSGSAGLLRNILLFSLTPFLIFALIALFITAILRLKKISTTNFSQILEMMIAASCTIFIPIGLGLLYSKVANDHSWLPHHALWYRHHVPLELLFLNITLCFAPMAVVLTSMLLKSGPTHIAPLSVKIGATLSHTVLFLVFSLTVGPEVLKHKDTLPHVEIGRSVPPITVQNLHNPKKETHTFEGRITLVDFWATWCGPCVDSLPGLEELHLRYNGDPRFEFLSINVEADRSEYVQKFAKEHKLSFKIFQDRGQAQRDFGIQSFPSMFLIDHHGKLAEAYFGRVPMSFIRGDIQKLLASIK